MYTRDELTHKIACVATTRDLNEAVAVRDEILDEHDALVAEVAQLSCRLRELYGDDATVEELLRLTPADRINHLKRLVRKTKEENKQLLHALDIIAHGEGYWASSVSSDDAWTQCRNIAIRAIEKWRGDQ